MEFSSRLTEATTCGRQNTAHVGVGYSKLVYQMLLSSNLLGLHLVLKHIPKHSTQNINVEGLFLMVHNQFMGERSDMVSF